MPTCPYCFKPNSEDAAVCIECGNSLLSTGSADPTRIASQTAQQLEPGHILAERYRIEKQLGQGGMGTVYLAADLELREKQVALKLIHPQILAKPDALQRFQDEVLICQELRHRSIVQVYDLKRLGEQRFYTMEYIAGQSLRELINTCKDQKPPFTLQEAAAIVLPLLEALAYAHKHTIHRDIKPENFMIIGDLPDVRIKVLDFGIAKTLSISRMTSMAQGMGTAYYMAPEQMEGQNIDHRADLYSVGMILYELLTGEMAVGMAKPPSVLIPTLPKAVDEVVSTLLERNSEMRYADSDKARKALYDVLSEHKVPEKKEQKTIHPKKPAEAKEPFHKRKKQKEPQEKPVGDRKTPPDKPEKAIKQAAPTKKKPAWKKPIPILIALLIISGIGAGLFYYTSSTVDAPKEPVSRTQSHQIKQPADNAPTERTQETKQSEPRRAKLYVNAEPKDARIRILNIKPAYERGMMLDAGRYHIEVSKSEFETHNSWIELSAGEEKNIDVTLVRNERKKGESNLPIVLQPSASSGKDTWTRGAKYRTTNYGKHVKFIVGALATGGDCRGFIQFDLETMPSKARSATLKLYSFYSKGRKNSGVINVYKVTESWNENDVTQINMPLFDSRIYAKTKAMNQDGWVTFDITRLYNEWKSEKQNYGLMINTEGSGNCAGSQPIGDCAIGAFYSSDYQESNFRPKLIIRP